MPPVLHTPPPPPSGTDALRTSEDDIAPQVSGMSGLTLLMGHFFLKPTLRKLPFIVLIVCIAGAIPAPPIALFLGWLLDIRWDHVFKDPQMLIAFACLGGACYALGGYLFCILPLAYLRSWLQKQPSRVRYLAGFLFAVIGAFSGYLLENSGVRGLLGGSNTLKSAPPTGRVAALSLMIVIGVTVLIVMIRTVRAEAELREHALGEAAARAQAHALQAQINPHFFFNTLTTVSALAEFDCPSRKLYRPHNYERRNEKSKLTADVGGKRKQAAGQCLNAIG